MSKTLKEYYIIDQNQRKLIVKATRKIDAIPKYEKLGYDHYRKLYSFAAYSDKEKAREAINNTYNRFEKKSKIHKDLSH